MEGAKLDGRITIRSKGLVDLIMGEALLTGVIIRQS